jgi:hypothetical protein
MEDFYRVQRYSAGPILDLVAAAGAGRGDDGFVRLIAYGGQEDQFADLLGQLKVFRFISE